MFFSPFIVPVGIAFAIALAAIFTGPIGKALAQRIAARGGVDPRQSAELRRELDDAARRLAAAETRIGELEDRVDFAERLLQQRKEARLGPGA